MSKSSRRFSSASAAGALVASLALLAGPAGGQQLGFAAASIEPVAGVSIEGPGPLRVPVAVRVRRGYHINSDRPNEAYLIPTRLSWPDAPFRVESIEYPAAEEFRSEFSEAALSVFSSRIEIVTTFAVDAVPDDLEALRGSFRFQACTDTVCLPPKTIPVTVPVLR